MSLLCSPQKRSEFKSTALLSFRKELPDNDYDVALKSELEKNIEIIVNELEQQGIKPTFFSQVTEDNDFNLDLANRYNCSFIEHDPSDINLETVFNNYGVAISNRLHVLLPAASSGCHPIALVSNNHRKIIDLFQTIGIADCVLLDSNIERCTNIIQSIKHDFDNLSTKLYLALLEQHTACQAFIKKMAYSGGNNHD
jgi:polysaccharide pyruvyl transferase WcaK-like protein